MCSGSVDSVSASPGDLYVAAPESLAREKRTGRQRADFGPVEKEARKGAAVSMGVLEHIFFCELSDAGMKRSHHGKDPLLGDPSLTSSFGHIASFLDLSSSLRESLLQVRRHFLFLGGLRSSFEPC